MLQSPEFLGRELLYATPEFWHQMYEKRNKKEDMTIPGYVGGDSLL